VTECNPQVDLFSIGRRIVTATFDDARLTSDAGVSFLHRIDKRLGLSDRLAAAMVDRRDCSKVRHTLRDLLMQRIALICAGYEDANDATALRHDPAFQLALGRVPGEAPLASQPTLSRFEQRSHRDLLALSNVLLDLWIERLKRKAKKSKKRLRIILDFDSTDFITHGDQQLNFFHGHYGNYIYYPVLVFDQDGFPVAAVLRSGDTRTGGVCAVLLRIMEKLSFALGKFDLLVRADAGFSTPELYRLCDTMGICYVVGLITHKTLRERAEGWMEEARESFDRTGEPVRLIREFQHRWGRKDGGTHRIITKAEVTALGDNPRFLITNMTVPPEQVYATYTGRGQCENQIKELKCAMLGDRMSCHAFAANQFRLLLHTAAYVLMFVLREQLDALSSTRMQMDTLRLRILKVAAVVKVSARHIWLHMSAHHPSTPLLQYLGSVLAPT
jgi:hypothetical protein